MNKNAGIVLEFNGHQYDLQKLMAIAKTCPRVELAGLTLNDENHPNASEHEVSFIPANATPVAEIVVIFKQHGNYTVLMGRELMPGGSAGVKALKAHLLSTPAMKKVRIEKHEPASVEQVVSSVATGTMADKMQQAFTQAAPVKSYERESTVFERERPEAPAVRRMTNYPRSTDHGNTETEYEKYKKQYFADNPHEVPPEKKTTATTSFKVQNSSISGRIDTSGSLHSQQVQQQHPDTHRPRAHQFGALQRKKI